MSFLNKIKGWGPKDEAATLDAPGVGAATFEGLPAANAGPVPEGHAQDTVGEAGYGVPTVQQAVDADTSIITEAAPSGMADFSETRVPDGEMAAASAGTGLPIIGKRPVAQQQRILFVMVGLGLVGLILMTVLSLLAANRGSAQVAASGQALMQSQRLAKSASQALIGSAQAFPEVRDSADVLARNVRGDRKSVV